MIITILQSIILGLVQGVTEFIPISSSAHLIIVPWLFGWTDPILTSLTFDVSLHLGTLIAVIIYFAKDWIRLIRAGVMSVIEWKIGNDADRRMAWFVVIGTIPGGVVGFLAEKKIDELFHQPGIPISSTAIIVMGLIIALLGTALFFADQYSHRIKDMNQITLKDAVIIGLSQALAIFPGVSRSGSTMTTGLALGLKRETAAKFSFFLSAPIILGAGLNSVYEIFKMRSSGAIAPNEWILFPIGVITAAISGFLCIHWLLTYLQKHSVNPFVFYRLGLALLIIVVAIFR